MLHPRPHHYDKDEPIVELKGIRCGYEGNTVLHDVDLRVMRGDFVGLLGPSGSGKTSLLRTVLGAVEIYDGEVLVEGVSVSEKRSLVGYVPQLETIDWNFPVTVGEVVLMGRTANSRLFPWFNREDRDRAEEIMERLGIAEFAKRHIRDLSGGQQQRTFLARALVSNPCLLLLDEPTSGVDIKTRDEVMHLLDELNHQDVTIVMTTHEINAVAAHLPRVVCVNETIIADGPPNDVFTPEILKRTYKADIHITNYQGMTLVAESPHFFGRNGRNGHHDHAEGALRRENQ